MKQIFISTKEYKDYELKISVQNRISDFWKDICKTASSKILKEMRKKPTNLILIISPSLVTKEVETYQFVSLNPSNELKEYLNQFYVYVEIDFKYEVDKTIQNIIRVNSINQ